MDETINYWQPSLSDLKIWSAPHIDSFWHQLKTFLGYGDPSVVSPAVDLIEVSIT